MKRSFAMAMAILTSVAAGTLLAGAGASPLAAQSTQTRVAALHAATFAVDNMTCALCPITVKRAMQRVAGVQSVEIDLASQTAVVQFDPALTTAAAIAKASSDAGYPATPRSLK